MDQNEVENKVKGARISLPTEAMTRTKSASGGVSFHCGDAVAKALNGLSLPFVKVLAEQALDIDTSKYEHLNPGQQRMTIGNVMRNMLRRNENLIDAFNEVLEKVQTQHDEATAEEREKAAAEKEAKQKLRDQAKLDKEQAKADREAERKLKAEKREADSQAKAKARADAAQARADERKRKDQVREEKRQARIDAKAQRDADKQQAALDKANAAAAADPESAE